MMQNKQFIGTGVAIVTPFDINNEVDFNSLEKLINHVINGKVNYIVVMGTTGEGSTLSSQERNDVTEFVIEKTDGRVPIVVGIGRNNTREMIRVIERTKFDKVDGILTVCPYYNKPTQEGIYQHYKKVAEVSPRPVIMYNVPGRTAVNMNACTVLRLAELDNIAGIKEASGNIPQIMKILKSKPDDFLMISGDDALTLPMISLGGKGVISVIANAFPKEYSMLVNTALKGDFSEARNLQFKLLSIIENLFVEGNPAGVKAALNILGLVENKLRLPLCPVSEKTYNRLKELIAQL